MSMPCLLADLMMQFWTYFSRFRKCQLSFMPFASALHAAVAFSRAILSAADIFAASAGVGTNAMPLISTAAIMPAIKVVAKWYMILSLSRYALRAWSPCRAAGVARNPQRADCIRPAHRHCDRRGVGREHRVRVHDGLHRDGRHGKLGVAPGGRKQFANLG